MPCNFICGLSDIIKKTFSQFKVHFRFRSVHKTTPQAAWISRGIHSRTNRSTYRLITQFVGGWPRQKQNCRGPMTADAILPDAGRSVVSSSSSWSRSRRGPSRRCTTMSTVDSTPPQLSSRTCGIVSISSVVYLMWITQTGRRSRPIDVTAGTIKNAAKYHARLHSAYTYDDAMQCNTIDVVPGSRKMQKYDFYIPHGNVADRAYYSQ